MELLPLVFLKDGKAIQPAPRKPAWFQEDPVVLAKVFRAQGANSLFIQDLNVPLAGKSVNFKAIRSIQEEKGLKLWILGNFRSLESIDHYAKLGVDKIVLSGAAYQQPRFVQEAVQKYGNRISVKIEVKNNRVVIPGMVAPSPKKVADYAKRFEEEGAAVLCFANNNAQGLLDRNSLQAIQNFCQETKVPVLCLSDVESREDLAKLFVFENNGLMGEVLGKSLYENRVDFHSAKSYLDDLAAAKSLEKD